MHFYQLNWIREDMETAGSKNVWQKTNHQQER